MNDRGFAIRRMTADQMGIAVEWAALEGWNPGYHDAECFYLADPNGFFIGELDGQPIGCVSAVAYDQAFGFLGFYIVKPEFRGRGFGIRLWNVALDYLGTRCVGLDGVVAQQPNYRKSGFNLAYRNIRYRGAHIASFVAGPDRIVELSTLPFDQVADYDRRMFPSSRISFLKCWIRQPGARALGAIGSEGEILGYGVMRPCRVGFRISPLFARDEHVAGTLFLSLAEHAAGAQVFLDIPDVNPYAASLVKRHNMEKVFETARMYTGQAPVLPLDQIFGVTSFELG